MIKKLFTSTLILCGMLLILNGCGSNTTLSTSLVQGNCPNGVIEAPYCMSVELSNSGGGQTWITNTSYPISGLSFFTTGAINVQTPSTNQSLMDPNNCTNSTIAPGSNCTFYLKISFESYSTISTESVNVNMTYTLNNNLFGGGDSTSSTSFTIYEVTNLYAVQSNGYVGIYNVNGNTNFYAESFGDPIATGATDTNSYGFLFIGGNNGIYRVGNESGNESSSSSISPAAFSGATTNLFNLSSTLYATPGSSIWGYSLSNESWNSAASYTLGTTLRPNANAISIGGVIYVASSNQVFTCGSLTTTTSCQADGVSTTSGSPPPGVINAIAFPNSGANSFTGLYIGTVGGLFAESGILNSPNNTWVPVTSASMAALPSITALSSYNGNLFAADVNGEIWYIPNNYTSGTPTAVKLATVLGSISAMTVDSIGGILYFASTTNGASTLYGCNITQNTCTPEASQNTLYPVVSLSIASQLVTGL